MLSESDLIKLFSNINSSPNNLLCGIGDDAAVIKIGEDNLVISKDTFIEGQDFDLSYFPLEAVGQKSVQASASDIVAMGIAPQYALLSLAIPSLARESDITLLRNGIAKACGDLTISLIGGDISKTTGPWVITLSIFGIASSKQKILRRDSAKPGDYVYVTGELGGSGAGLIAFQRNLAGFRHTKQKHLYPKCRNDLINFLQTQASSVIDISDGLGSELRHICGNSKVGAVIYEENIPVNLETTQIEKLAGLKPRELAWTGGEDFELLFTSKEKLAENLAVKLIGEIKKELEISVIDSLGGLKNLEYLGFKHFY